MDEQHKQKAEHLILGISHSIANYKKGMADNDSVMKTNAKCQLDETIESAVYLGLIKVFDEDLEAILFLLLNNPNLYQLRLLFRILI
jgi:hypothetical protein